MTTSRPAAAPADEPSLYLKVSAAARLVGCSRTAFYDLLDGYGGSVSWVKFSPGAPIMVNRASLTDFLARCEAEAAASRAS